MQSFEAVNEIHGKYINLSRLFSFNWARVFIVIGARGYGKTFACKRKCLKDFKYKGHKFVIMRDTVSACDEICANNGQKLFNDVFTTCKAFRNDTYDVENYTIKINNQYAGEILPMSVYYKYKGNSYNAEWVLFDEFIEESVQAYRGNRARQFVNMIETILRDSKTARVVLTANALDLGNDILEVFGFNIKSGQFGYYKNEDKKVVLFYAPNSQEFEERKRESVSGLITRGTFLDDSMNKNKFEGASCQIYERRKPCKLNGIYYNSEGEPFRLYQANDGSTYYACKDINENSYPYMRYVFKSNQSGKDRVLLNVNDYKKWFKGLLQSNQIQFESKYIFNVFCSIVNDTLHK